MRAIWSGSIGFGLVNIPVRLYSASRERALSFRLLSKDDHCPISYKKVCREDDKVVPQEEIVKGYEYEKGEYVVLDDSDFKKAAPKKTETIEVAQFAELDEIDPKYFDKPYWIEADKKAAKAYALLRDALKESKKAAIVRYVIRDKEHLGIIKTEGDLLLLEQMRYNDELREPEDIEAPKASYAKKELELALSLVKSLTKSFKPSAYKDTYAKALMKVIEAKAKHKTVKVGREKHAKPTSSEDIIKALQASLKREPEPIKG